MSKKRGLSLEEKKQAVLEIFHETKDVFQLKDLEKLAPKKGVIQPSVKEVVQALIDDELAHMDKIGSSNFFWSYPNEAQVKLQSKYQQLQDKLSNLDQQKLEFEQKLASEKSSRPDTEHRAAKMAEMHGLESKLKDLQKELSQYDDADPQKVEALREASEIAKAAANRWLDNTWALESWCKKRFEAQADQLSSFFKENGLSDDIDYI